MSQETASEPIDKKVPELSSEDLAWVRERLITLCKDCTIVEENHLISEVVREQISRTMTNGKNTLNLWIDVHDELRKLVDEGIIKPIALTSNKSSNLLRTVYHHSDLMVVQH